MCVVILRGNRGPYLRYFLAITNRCRALTWLPQSGCMFVLCTGVIPVEACGHNPLPHFLCTGVTPVEECRHHCPPHPPFIFRRPGLRLGLCALFAHSRASRGMYNSSTFDVGGVFYTVFSFRGGWPNACAIDALLNPLYAERL